MPGQSGAGEPHRDISKKGAPGHRYQKSGAERKDDERSVRVRHSEACHSKRSLETRSISEGVTLNVACARSAFCGRGEVVFRRWHSVVVVTHGALSQLTSPQVWG